MKERSDGVEISLLADLIEFADGHIGCAIRGIRARISEGNTDAVLAILSMLELNRASLLAKVSSANSGMPIRGGA
jgi:hypothetical protein